MIASCIIYARKKRRRVVKRKRRRSMKVVQRKLIPKIHPHRVKLMMTMTMFLGASSQVS